LLSFQNCSQFIRSKKLSWSSLPSSAQLLIQIYLWLSWGREQGRQGSK
jgi:hypothetical protein